MYSGSLSYRAENSSTYVRGQYGALPMHWISGKVTNISLSENTYCEFISRWYHIAEMGVGTLLNHTKSEMGVGTLLNHTKSAMGKEAHRKPIVSAIYNSVMYEVDNLDTFEEQQFEGYMYSRVRTPNSVEVEKVHADHRVIIRTNPLPFIKHF